MGIREGKFVDLGMPSSGKKAFLWTTENSAMSGSRASQEHEQRPCVNMVDRSGHLYWMIRIPASQHLRRMGATATSVSRVESVSGVGPSHILPWRPHPHRLCGLQQTRTVVKVMARWHMCLLAMTFTTVRVALMMMVFRTKTLVTQSLQCACWP